ncbi:hypothetical protein ACU8DI_10490 [Psychroserpens sp. BH13MA-6]
MKIKTMAITVMCATFMLNCNVDKKKDMELPEVDVDMDVSAEEGQLPTYDVDWADVNVGTTTKTVNVPKVVVVMEEEEVEVPYIDVDMPDSDDNDKEERTLMIEAEVTGNEHTLDIKEIWASDNNLYVISELVETDQSIADKKMRVSDQVTLNAPELNVKHYIIGERPDRVFNTQHTYVADMNTLKSKMNGDYKVIYNK